MKKYNAETELEKRLETLDNEIMRTKAGSDRKTALLKLKKKLANGEETFANSTYAEQFQRECLNKARTLFNYALKESLPICFSAVNICREVRGREKTKQHVGCLMMRLNLSMHDRPSIRCGSNSEFYRSVAASLL